MFAGKRWMEGGGGLPIKAVPEKILDYDVLVVEEKHCVCDGEEKRGEACCLNACRSTSKWG
jgi:hypothetical protein